MFRTFGGLRSVLRAEAGDAGADGGGAGAGAATIPPEVKALIDSAVAEATKGLVSKNQELIGTIKQTKERLKAYDGIDPDQTRALMQRLATDEEARLIAEGKTDEVFNRRTERLKADFESKLKAASEEAEKARKQAQAFQGRVLDEAIRAATAKAGLHPFAVEDALLRARSMFKLDESGNAVAIGADGNPVYGKDGKTPLSPSEWIEGMRANAPHWFPAGASGGGTAAGLSAGGGPLNRSKMTTKEKAEYIAKNGQQAYLSLPM